MKMESSYYPQRASSVPFRRVRLFFSRHGARIPEPLTLLRATTVFAIPGAGLYFAGWRLWGKVAMLGSLVLTAVFFVFLGHTLSNVAFTIMLSVHSTGILFFLRPWMSEVRFLSRLFIGFLVMFALCALLYIPLQRFLEHHLVMPLFTHGRVYMVQPSTQVRGIRVGSWIAYRLAETGGPGFVIRGGYGLGVVMAKGGDHITFTSTEFRLNGVAFPRLAHMPSIGGTVVPENCWFVWPQMDITLRGRVTEDAVASALLQMAVVYPEQLVGRPFDRWFWKRQLPY